MPPSKLLGGDSLLNIRRYKWKVVAQEIADKPNADRNEVTHILHGLGLNVVRMLIDGWRSEGRTDDRTTGA